MNNVSLIGRLTKDPEMRITSSGKAVCNFTLAVKRPFHPDETDFINCEAWGKTAEVITEHLTKGRLIGVSGYLKIDSYEEEAGTRKKFHKIVVSQFDFCEKKNSTKSSNSNVIEEDDPFAID